MRTIKFRGKRLNNGEWVYGYYVHQYGTHEIYLHDTATSEFVSIHVDPSTVGEFIGLFDKDGKEVYEHDIFPKGVIGFSRGCFNGFYTESRNDEKGWDYSDVWEDLPHTYCYAHSVLGNIHDNNNFLKNEE